VRTVVSWMASSMKEVMRLSPEILLNVAPSTVIRFSSAVAPGDDRCRAGARRTSFQLQRAAWVQRCVPSAACLITDCCVALNLGAEHRRRVARDRDVLGGWD